MFKEFSNNKDDDYLSEFRQKVASEREAQMQARKQELERSRNSFIGTIAGIILAALVSWFLLMPRFAKENNNEIVVIHRPINPVKIQPNDPGGMEILNQDKSVYALVEKHQVETIKVESILPTPEKPKLPEIVPEPQDIAQPKPNEDIKSENTEPKQNNILVVKNMEELIEEVETSTTQKIDIPQKPTDIKLEVKTVEPIKKEEPKKIAVKEPQTTDNLQSAVNGKWQVQLMASANKEAIEKGWKNLSSKYVSLKNLSYEIETAKMDSGETVYRLKAGAFSTREQADKLCGELKKSGESCIVKQKQR